MPTAKKHASSAQTPLRLVTTPSEGKYQVLFEQASDAILTATEDGRVDDANLALQELTGYLKDELVAHSIGRLAPDPTKTRVSERSRPFTTEMLSTAGFYEDIAILRKDGYLRLVDLSVREIESDEGKLHLALLRDITEKKNMERELITKHTELRNAYVQLERSNAELKSMQDSLIQAGKMAALGELAAGIAHELNQPLQAIRGYAQELSSSLSLASDQKAFFDEILGGVDKMAKIIQHLRTFTRSSTEEHEFTSVEKALEESLKMLSRQFASRGIEVHRDYGPGLPAIYANPIQLEQVFINLATNARDAIESTGRGRGNIWIQTRAAGKFVEVVYKDDGVGMSEATKSKVFNPFFTTKEVGKGMGLGMSISYGILGKLNASVVVESDLGKGAAFRIRFPLDFREL
jgi:PAS domain S-box-containing protein